MAAFALTIFTGAFLLFQVQPLIGKYILPWFGGGPGVWTTCMLFFQLLLLGGYAYAHFTSRWLKPRAQAVVHLILLAASIGLPYFVLSATGPLIQQWFSRARPGQSPYRLYALSNVGSLLALVSYPFFFETHFTRKTQAGLWAWGLAAYAVCCGFCAVRLWRSEVQSPKSKVQSQGPDEAEHATRNTQQASLNPQPSTLSLLLWLLLPACASVLLLATTNKLCQDVAVIPFLWVAPLALYLLSFIICFDSPRWYVRFPFALALVAALGGLCWALYNGSDLALYGQLAIYCGALFVCCMVCHGELYRLKPDPGHLTRYYLMIAAGGALGGVFVAIIAPLVFADYYELQWGMLACGLLFLIVCISDRSPRPRWNDWRWLACALALVTFAGLDRLLAWLPVHVPKAIDTTWVVGLRVCLWVLVVGWAVFWTVRGEFRSFRLWRVLTCAWLCLGLVSLGAILWQQAHDSGGDRVFRSRNFYGVLTVYEHDKHDPESHHFLLQHGRITHGLEFVDPVQAMLPVSYYGPESGIALGVNALPAGRRRIGVVGLGTGTMAAFARPGDYLRFYEINPQVQAVATTWFHYLPKCAGDVEVALGDARLSLENEPPQNFDLLVLDAFSSDAIPVHLLTREAFEVYQRHLNTNGVIAVHISNHYLDLEPVVVNLARHFGYKLASIDYEETDEEWWLYSSTWVLLSHNDRIMNSPTIRTVASTVNTNRTRVPLWTDDFASLFQILR